MAISKEIVDYVAHLARIELDRSELSKLAGQLTGILDFIDKLKAVDITKINPTSHILPLKNIFRQDNLKESLSLPKTLENAPEKKGDFFVVPKVIE